MYFRHNKSVPQVASSALRGKPGQAGAVPPLYLATKAAKKPLLLDPPAGGLRAGRRGE
jgi:hypothetical protein